MSEEVHLGWTSRAYHLSAGVCADGHVVLSLLVRAEDANHDGVLAQSYAYTLQTSIDGVAWETALTREAPPSDSAAQKLSAATGAGVGTAQVTSQPHC